MEKKSIFISLHICCFLKTAALRASGWVFDRRRARTSVQSVVSNIFLSSNHNRVIDRLYPGGTGGRGSSPEVCVHKCDKWRKGPWGCVCLTWVEIQSEYPVFSVRYVSSTKNSPLNPELGCFQCSRDDETAPILTVHSVCVSITCPLRKRLFVIGDKVGSASCTIT